MSYTNSLQSLAVMARACAPTKTVTDQKMLRRFSTWEISNFMFHLPADTLRKKLLEDPSLPQGLIQADGRQRWFTLAEVNELRRRLRFRKHKLMPIRAAGRAQHIAFLGTRREIGTTTLVQHMAHATALAGFRVLLIDLTANATLSQMHGTTGNMHELLVWDFARETDPSAELGASKIVQATHWPNIDIVAADPKSPMTDREFLRLYTSNPDWDPTDAVVQLLGEQTMQAYDFVLMDCASDLGIVSWNGLTAATQLNIVNGAAASDFAHLSQCLDALTREALSFSNIQIFTTRFDPLDPCHATAKAKALSTFGTHINQPPVHDVSAINSLHPAAASVYEQDYRTSTRADWEVARTSFDQAFAQMSFRADQMV